MWKIPFSQLEIKAVGTIRFITVSRLSLRFEGVFLNGKIAEIFIVSFFQTRKTIQCVLIFLRNFSRSRKSVGDNLSDRILKLTMDRGILMKSLERWDNEFVHIHKRKIN
jgi:hypothetical protein